LGQSTGSGKDHIGYQALTQAALRAVVRAAMDKAAKLGRLPGDHHFYVTFRTRLRGVEMDDALKDRFPDEMTIVVQHQYWDFNVHDTYFEIMLKFGGQAQHLRVPFSAITRFYDPSVNFGVQFDGDGTGGEPLPNIDDVKDGPADVAAKTLAEEAKGAVVSLDAFRRK
jgi:hypothetical protein